MTRKVKAERELAPIQVDGNTWMYPEAAALCVVHQAIGGTRIFNVPWRLVRLALRRKVRITPHAKKKGKH